MAHPTNSFAPPISPASPAATSRSASVTGNSRSARSASSGRRKSVVESQSASIADGAANIEATREITAKTAEECGFGSPTVSADVVTNDGAEYSVLIGADSPDGTGVYLKLSTDDKIYLVESSVKEVFEFDALSLAATDSAPGITVTDDMDDYTDDSGSLISFDTITVNGKNFPETLVLAPNTDESLSDIAAFMTTTPSKRIADNVDSLFNIFKSGLSVSGAYSFDTSAAGQKSVGLDNPDFEATMKAGTQSYTYRFKEQEDGGYAVWFTGCKLIGKVDASSLEFIDYDTSDFYASWVCLQSINELSNFTIKTADKTYSFDIVYDDSEDAEETYVITYNGEKLVAENDINVVCYFALMLGVYCRKRFRRSGGFNNLYLFRHIQGTDDGGIQESKRDALSVPHRRY